MIVQVVGNHATNVQAATQAFFLSLFLQFLFKNTTNVVTKNRKRKDISRIGILIT